MDSLYRSSNMVSPTSSINNSAKKLSNGNLPINALLNNASSLPTPETSPANDPVHNPSQDISGALQSQRISDPALYSPRSDGPRTPLFEAQDGDDARESHEQTRLLSPQTEQYSPSRAQRQTVTLPSLSSVNNFTPLPSRARQLAPSSPPHLVARLERPPPPGALARPYEPVMQGQLYASYQRRPESYRLAIFRDAELRAQGASSLELLAIGAELIEQLDRSDSGARVEASMPPERSPRAHPRSNSNATPRASGRVRTANRNRAASTSSPNLNNRTNGQQRQSRRRAHTGDDEDGPAPKRMRAEAKIKEKFESYTQMVDFCPPASTINAGAVETAKDSWRSTGKANDMSKDPLKHLLHPLEIEFCELNSLDANKFLGNKRRIIRGFVASLNDDYQYTKTKAQGWSCIDVNKASRMWVFFDAAGWFNPVYYNTAKLQELELRQKEEAEKARKAKEEALKEEDASA